ncbi:MAG TPA: hypothetical protein DDX92_01820 [Flavobacteriales bacterium]|jgi:uncharacterized protein YndB with AHSA1/START domain|nr:hypothetical protein [Flavobacteriales bacterium]
MAEKEKYEREYTIRSSPNVLYNFIATPSGLSEWFSDNVTIKNDVYTFHWDDSQEQAHLLGRKDKEYARFRWLEDEGTNAYFEMRIKIDSLTKDVALIVTDYAEADEIEESAMLWDSQIEELKHVIGS